MAFFQKILPSSDHDEEEISRLRAKRAEVEADYDQHKTKVAKLTRATTQLQANIAGLSNVHDKYKSNVQQFQKFQQMMTKHSEIKRLQKRNSELTKQNQRLQREAAATLSRTHTDTFWADIAEKCRSDPDAVKTLIVNGTIDVQAGKDMSILMMAANAGAYDLVQLCLNLGANVEQKDKDGHDAIYWARHGAWYHIEQLLIFSKMKASGGDEVKQTANIMNQQDGIAQNLIKRLSQYDEQRRDIVQETLIESMMDIIAQRQSFSDDLLNLCLQFECEKGTDFLDTRLWKCISKTCSDIIHSGSKLDWFWLKTVMLPSTIWFKDMLSGSPAADEKQQEETQKKEEEDANSKPAYLYYELLRLVGGEAKAGLATLEKNLSGLAEKDLDAWQQLVAWDIADDARYAEGVRQDVVPNAITAKYSHKELSEQQCSSSTFNAHAFYDYNEYLPQLMLLAQMVDDEFQKSVQRIFNVDTRNNTANLNHDDDDDVKVDKEGDGVIKYSRGPVKLMERARYKAQNDYVHEAFPTSACVLDLNRCSLIFDDISSMLKAIKLFVNKVKYYQSGCIIGIVRDKNGFKEYVKETQYADIKLNVLIKGKNNCIIGEVQFLLDTMKRFKEKAHNLYAIQRQQEYFDTSVTQILPMLLDEHKQLFVAGSMGDVKALCKMMLFSNKTQDDIMKIDAKSGDSILNNICALHQEKALRFLHSIIPHHLLIQRLFTPNRSDRTAAEQAFDGNHHLITRYLLSIDAVRHKIESDAMSKRRLLRCVYASCDLTLIHSVRRTLAISDEELLSILQEAPQTNDETPSLLKQSLLHCAAQNEHDGILQSLQSLVDRAKPETFVSLLFRPNADGANVVDRSVYNNNTTAILYLLSLDSVKIRYRVNSDPDTCCNLMRHLFLAPRIEPEMIGHILQTLQIERRDLVALLGHDYKGNSLLTVIAGMAPVATLQRLVSKIGVDEFAHHMFVSDGSGVNPLGMCLMANSRRAELMRYLLSLPQIRARCVEDKQVLFSVVQLVLLKYADDLRDAVVSALQLDVLKLKELQSQYQKPTDEEISKLLSGKDDVNDDMADID